MDRGSCVAGQALPQSWPRAQRMGLATWVTVVLSSLRAVAERMSFGKYLADVCCLRLGAVHACGRGRQYMGSHKVTLLYHRCCVQWLNAGNGIERETSLTRTLMSMPSPHKYTSGGGAMHVQTSSLSPTCMC